MRHLINNGNNSFIKLNENKNDNLTACSAFLCAQV